MNRYQSYEQLQESSFDYIPVVRLDSGAVRVPVELIEDIAVPRSKKRVLRITYTTDSFCAWR